MKKKKRERLILLILVVIFLGYAVYNYYLVSSNEKIISLNNEKREIEAQLKVLQEFSPKKKDVENQIEQLKTAEAIISEKIPDYNYSSELIAELYSLSTKKVLDAQNININYEETADKGIIKVSLDTFGDIDEIEQVVSYFKNNKRKFYLKSFTVQSEKENDYKASLNLEAYYRIDKKGK